MPFGTLYRPWILGRMFTNIGYTIRVGFKILAKGILILRPHYISYIESQAKQCRFANMVNNAHGQFEDA